jgi:hypothetical protein
MSGQLTYKNKERTFFFLTGKYTQLLASSQYYLRGRSRGCAISQIKNEKEGQIRAEK